MAKLGIREAARAVGVTHSTIQRRIKKGDLTLDSEGRLDSADLVRAGFKLKEDMLVSLSMTHEDLAEIFAERDRLRLELEASLARERAALAREMHLLERLEQAEQRQRQLDVSSSIPITRVIQAGSYSKSTKVNPSKLGQIIDFMVTIPTPLAPSTVQEALKLPDNPQHIMQRMHDAGLLKRPEPGKYVLAEDGVEDKAQSGPL